VGLYSDRNDEQSACALAPEGSSHGFKTSICGDFVVRGEWGALNFGGKLIVTTSISYYVLQILFLWIGAWVFPVFSMWGFPRLVRLAGSGWGVLIGSSEDFHRFLGERAGPIELVYLLRLSWLGSCWEAFCSDVYMGSGDGEVVVAGTRTPGMFWRGIFCVSSSLYYI
jgi:hypothetical protein